MSKSLNKDDLKKLFGGGLGFLKSSNENTNPGDPALDKERDDYRKANQTLAIRNHQLKMELASSRRAMDELRGENEELRGRLAALESTSLDDRAEMIINQRIKKKLSQLTAISQRTMSYLGKATADFQSVLDNFGMDDVDEEDMLAVCSTAGEGVEQLEKELRPGRANRPSTSHVPVLDKLEESPVRLRRPAKPSSGRKKHGPIKVEAETPRVTADRRRSALITAPPLDMPATLDDDEVDATPRAAPQQSRRPQPAATLRTPAPPAFDAAPNPFTETEDADENVNVNDTVRRKRNAAAKITSFAEPSLTTKLRRPGKNDAPCPYIS